MDKEALSGLKVLEYSDFISGPYCGKLLADLGAEVIKVEKPGLGDKARSWGPFPQDIPHLEKSGLFLGLNTNKLGITLNVSSALGVKIFKELVKKVDILIENNPPRKMEELAIDYESLRQSNPLLIMTSITPFGQTGPYRDYTGCDLISFHVSGEAYVNPADGVTDLEKQPPLQGPMHRGDFMTALFGGISTMSAVFARQVTGRGQHVDLSQQEVLSSVVRRNITHFIYDGTPFDRIAGQGTRGLFPCKDGYIMVRVTSDDFWAGLVGTLGNPDWAKSEKFQDVASRRANHTEIESLIIESMKERTMGELLAAAAKSKRFPIMPVQTMKEIINTEQLAERQFFVEIEHKEAGKFKYAGAPYKLSATPWRVKRPAPVLGEHNEEVYCHLLGYTRQDLVKMRQAGVI